MEIVEKLKAYSSSLKTNQLIVIDSFKKINDDKTFNYVVIAGKLNKSITIKVVDDNKIILHTYKVRQNLLLNKLLWVVKKFNFSIKSLYYISDYSTKEAVFDSINVENQIEFSISSSPTQTDKLEITYIIHQEKINYLKLVQCFDEYQQMIGEGSSFDIVHHQSHPINILRLEKLKSIGID